MVSQLLVQIPWPLILHPLECLRCDEIKSSLYSNSSIVIYCYEQDLKFKLCNNHRGLNTFWTFFLNHSMNENLMNATLSFWKQKNRRPITFFSQVYLLSILRTTISIHPIPFEILSKDPSWLQLCSITLSAQEFILIFMYTLSPVSMLLILVLGI